jgi:hypothetical protein
MLLSLVSCWCSARQIDFSFWWKEADNRISKEELLRASEAGVLRGKS